MNKLLVIDSSGRVTRSITRGLTRRFAERWKARHPGGEVVARDVGQAPPPAVNEAWIAAAFAHPERRTEAMKEALRVSDALIDEIVGADAIVMGVPMYNFGMPAQLKAYFDQVVRVGRTFAFDAEAAEPYRGLLRGRPVVVIVSAGDGALHPGGKLEGMNFLEGHLRTIWGFMGVGEVTFLRVGYDEFQDGRLRESIARAEGEVEELAGRV